MESSIMNDEIWKNSGWPRARQRSALVRMLVCTMPDNISMEEFIDSVSTEIRETKIPRPSQVDSNNDWEFSTLVHQIVEKRKTACDDDSSNEGDFFSIPASPEPGSQGMEDVSTVTLAVIDTMDDPVGETGPVGDVVGTTPSPNERPNNNLSEWVISKTTAANIIDQGETDDPSVSPSTTTPSQSRYDLRQRHQAPAVMAIGTFDEMEGNDVVASGETMKDGIQSAPDLETSSLNSLQDCPDTNNDNDTMGQVVAEGSSMLAGETGEGEDFTIRQEMVSGDDSDVVGPSTTESDVRNPKYSLRSNGPVPNDTIDVETDDRTLTEDMSDVGLGEELVKESTFVEEVVELNDGNGDSRSEENLSLPNNAEATRDDVAKFSIVLRDNGRPEDVMAGGGSHVLAETPGIEDAEEDQSVLGRDAESDIDSDTTSVPNDNGDSPRSLFPPTPPIVASRPEFPSDDAYVAGDEADLTNDVAMDDAAMEDVIAVETAEMNPHEGNVAMDVHADSEAAGQDESALNNSSTVGQEDVLAKDDAIAVGDFTAFSDSEVKVATEVDANKDVVGQDTTGKMVVGGKSDSLSSPTDEEHDNIYPVCTNSNAVTPFKETTNRTRPGDSRENGIELTSDDVDPFRFLKDEIIDEISAYRSLMKTACGKDDMHASDLRSIAMSDLSLSDVLQQNIGADRAVLSAKAKQRIFLIQLVNSYEREFGYAGTKALLTLRVFLGKNPGVKDAQKAYEDEICQLSIATLETMYSRKRSGAQGDLTKRWFKGKIREGRRWHELVMEIGWVIALFGDWIPQTWFSAAPHDSWVRNRDSLIQKRCWIRETARQTLGAGYEWIMQGPTDYDRSAWLDNSIFITKESAVKPPRKSLPCWPWRLNSCLLDAKLTCLVGLAFSLPPKSFFSPDRLGKRLLRQFRFELGRLMENVKCWNEIPPQSLFKLRDNVRNYLLDPHFTDPQITVDDKTEFDKLDPHLLHSDLIEWYIVRRGSCTSCDYVTEATFAKSLRGLLLKMDSERSHSFRNVQEVVDQIIENDYNLGTHPPRVEPLTCDICGRTMINEFAVKAFPMVLLLHYDYSRSASLSDGKCQIGECDIPRILTWQKEKYQFVGAILHSADQLHWSSVSLYRDILYYGQVIDGGDWLKPGLKQVERNYDTSDIAWKTSDIKTMCPVQYFYTRMSAHDTDNCTPEGNWFRLDDSTSTDLDDTTQSLPPIRTEKKPSTSTVATVPELPDDDPTSSSLHLPELVLSPSTPRPQRPMINRLLPSETPVAMFSTNRNGYPTPPTTKSMTRKRPRSAEDDPADGSNAVRRVRTRH